VANARLPAFAADAHIAAPAAIAAPRRYGIVGDLFGGMFAQLYGRVSPGLYFLLQAAIALGAALVFGWIANDRTAAPAVTHPARDGAARLASDAT
jgi:hypothetical protein